MVTKHRQNSAEALEDFELVTSKAIRSQLSHHVARHWMIDELTAADVEDMVPFVPSNTRQVVDLCCGTGRVSIGLEKLLLRGRAKFWLVDGDVAQPVKEIERHWQRYEDDSIARFYNKRQITEECCRINELPNYEYIEVSQDLEWSKLPENVDFLFSNRGIGCHWPLSIYAHIYPKILRDGAICMFMKGEALGDIPDYFCEVAVVREKIQERELIVLRFDS